MDQAIYLILAILILILLGVIGLLFVLVFKLMKQKNTEAPQAAPTPNYHPDITARFQEAKKIKQAILGQSIYCPNHPEEVGETTCAICGKFFCKKCIRPYKTLHFCKEHLSLVMTKEWEEVTTIKSHTNDPEAGVELIEKKQKWWDEDQLATYIETHYKIDVDNDYIETYLVLFGIREQIEDIKKRL